MFPYVALILIFSILSQYRYRNEYILRIPALILLIIFIGLRNEIGTDYLTYKEIFEMSLGLDYGDWPIEPGWHFINRLVLSFIGEFKVVTIIHAAIIVVLLHLSLKDFKYYTFGFVLFILVTTGYIFIVNGMRQGVAMAVFFYSWRFIKSRDFLKYTICIIIGILFHFSVIFVAPIYFIAYKTFDVKFYIIVQFVTLFLYYTHLFDSFFVKLIYYTSYDHYLESQFMDTAINSGMGFMIKRVGRFIVLICYGKLLKEYPQYIVWFNMYFLMVVAGDLFANIMILGRMTHYFSWSIFIVVPIFLSAIFKPGGSHILSKAFVLAVYFIFFTYIVYTDTLNNLIYTF